MSRTASPHHIRQTADLFCGQPGLDAEIVLLGSRVRIRQLDPSSAEHVDTTFVDLDRGETIYIDGAITALEGEVDGTLTIFGNRAVRVSGPIVCGEDGRVRVIGREEVVGAAATDRVVLLSAEGQVHTSTAES